MKKYLIKLHYEQIVDSENEEDAVAVFKSKLESENSSIENKIIDNISINKL